MAGRSSSLVENHCLQHPHTRQRALPAEKILPDTKKVPGTRECKARKTLLILEQMCFVWLFGVAFGEDA